MVCENSLYHHGIKGMRWGVRRYQNEDGSLTAAGKRRERRKRDIVDTIWASNQKDFLIFKNKRAVAEKMKKYEEGLYRTRLYKNSDGTLNELGINSYNKELARAMNKKVGDIEAPSGRVVRFVAKRGEIGVQMALVDPSRDIGKQVMSSGWSDQVFGKTPTNRRIAYKGNAIKLLD